MMTSIQLPAPLRAFYSRFPILTHSAISSPSKPTISQPTIWIHPPHNPGSSTLSRDVECLKWQAYLAFRGLKGVAIRWDIHAEGGIDGQLPNLHVPLGDSDGLLLSTSKICAWVDGKLGSLELDGYQDEAARDESHAWISLLEGNVHAALVDLLNLLCQNSAPSECHCQLLAQPSSPALVELLFPESNKTPSLQSFLTPPPAPSSGFFSLIPTFGVRVDTAAVESRYIEAIASLSECLGSDQWFLSSP